jgi:bacterioferritin-associated ferredoxin
MIVCVCHAVSDRTLREAVRGGAASREAVVVATRAGTSCGCCEAELSRAVAAAIGECRQSRGEPCIGCPREGEGLRAA